MFSFTASLIAPYHVLIAVIAPCPPFNSPYLALSRVSDRYNIEVISTFSDRSLLNLVKVPSEVHADFLRSSSSGWNIPALRNLSFGIDCQSACGTKKWSRYSPRFIPVRPSSILLSVTPSYTWSGLYAREKMLVKRLKDHPSLVRKCV
jgi:hypothetical protein